MKHRLRTIIITAGLAVGLALPAFAQQALPDPAPDTDRPSDAQREAIRRKMEAIRIVRLTEALNLDDETAAKFIPAITTLDQQRRTLLKENREILREMRLRLGEPAPDMAKLRTAVENVERKFREIASLREKEFSAMRSSLTVEQQARYLIFHQDFIREMRVMVEGIRGSRANNGPVRRPLRQPPPDDAP